MVKGSFTSIMIFISALLFAQSEADLGDDVVEQFIAQAEEQEYTLIAREKCDRPPGEMCRWPYEITPDIRSLDIVVIGNKRTKPSFAVEDAQADNVITFTREEDVTSNGKVNFVRRSFSLKKSQISVTFHFGNTRSYMTESTSMLIFAK